MTNSSKSTEEILNVAIDDGYAQTKAIGPDGNITCFLTSVRPGRHAKSSMDGQVVSGFYETNGGVYVVDAEVGGEDTRYDGYHGSELNRIAVHHALHELGLAGRKVSLVVGMPLQEFFDDHGKPNSDAIAAKKKSLLEPVVYRRDNDATSVDVVAVTVISQGVAAYLDFLIDDDGGQREEADGPIVVVDIGGRTTDIAHLSDYNTLEHNRSGTTNTGVLDVAAALKPDLVARCKILPAEAKESVLDNAIRTGETLQFGRPVKCADLVASAAEGPKRTLERTLRNKLGSGAFARKVLFVGGGTNVFRGLAEMFPHSVIVDDPEYANVRGMRKFQAI